MLDAADQHLVKSDPDLPGLRWLLDPEAFQALIEQLLPDSGIVAERAGYVRYKQGTSMLVSYSTKSLGPSSYVYGKAFPLRDREKLEKRRSVGGRNRQGVPLVGVHAGLGISLHAFPADPEIPGLRFLGGDRDQRPGLSNL
ncbi:MAG TPA: hypothetical protein VIY86_00015, partial [Pirellulaceae bacterium]